MKEKPTESRGGVKGGFPLAGSRGGAPLWGLGQRPNCCAGDKFQGSRQQGAGSEASLPVTSRSRRSAPKLLYPASMLCRARWARPRCWACDHSCSFPQAGDFTPVTASPRALWGAKSVLLMQPLAVLRRKERQLDVFDAFLHPMRLAKQGNMM